MKIQLLLLILHCNNWKNNFYMDLYSLTDGAILKLIGEQIRRNRLDRNITQKQLAKSAGVSLSCLSSLEKGQSVSLISIIPILRSLNLLHLLSGFIKKPEISPIAYAKMLEGQTKRQRASAPKSIKQNNFSEW